MNPAPDRRATREEPPEGWTHQEQPGSVKIIGGRKSRPQCRTGPARDVGGTLWRQGHSFRHASTSSRYQLKLFPIVSPNARVLFEAAPGPPLAKS